MEVGAWTSSTRAWNCTEMCSVEGRIDRSIGENQQALHAVVDVDVDVEYRIHSHYITYHVSSFPYPDTVMVDMY